MEVGAERKKGVALGQPLKPAAIAAIICALLALGAVAAIAYWNGADRLGKPYIAQPGNPYYKLELSRLILDTNYSLVAPNRLRFGVGLPREGAGGGGQSTRPPVEYLPLKAKPTPTPDVFRLSGAFKEALREIATARLAQGGLVMPDEFVPDPKDPANRIPAPEGSLNPGNGYLKLYFEVDRDKDPGGALLFRVSYEVWRQVYVTQDAPYRNTIKVDEGASGPFRVREKTP